jgi:enoyl-CoA hydratase/carnithine racemase
MEESHALLERDGAVLILTLNRPEKLNAIDREIEGVIAQAASDLDRDDALRVLLIQARGRFFSGGFDLNGRLSDRHDDGGIATRRWYREIHALFDGFEVAEKLVVAAVHGPCLGGALEMALSCDFRLVSSDAYFQLPEIDLGVLPGSGGVSRLTRLVGPGWARWLVMGERIDADRAREIGLVHEVYPAGVFSTRVRGFVERLAALPAEAVALGKLAIDACERTDRATGRDIERISNSLLLGSEDYRARVDAAKRRRA